MKRFTHIGEKTMLIGLRVNDQSSEAEDTGLQVQEGVRNT